MRQLFEYWKVILFFLSVIIIIVALIAEYFFNLAPCEMCLKQRHPYYIIIICISLSYFIKKFQNIWLYIIIEISLFYGIFYAIWHVGIEQKLIKGPSGCSGQLSPTDSIENLKKQILNQDLVNCSEISWSIFGISAASINSILILSILIFNTIYIINNYGQKKN